MEPSDESSAVVTHELDAEPSDTADHVEDSDDEQLDPKVALAWKHEAEQEKLWEENVLKASQNEVDESANEEVVVEEATNNFDAEVDASHEKKEHQEEVDQRDEGHDDEMQEGADVEPAIKEAWKKEEEEEQNWERKVTAQQAEDDDDNSFPAPSKEITETETVDQSIAIEHHSAEKDVSASLEKLPTPSENKSTPTEAVKIELPRRIEAQETGPKPSRNPRASYVSLPRDALLKREQVRLKEDAAFLKELIEYKARKFYQDAESRTYELSVAKAVMMQRKIDDKNKRMEREKTWKAKRQLAIKEYEERSNQLKERLQQEKAEVRQRIASMDAKRREREAVKLNVVKLLA